MATATALDLDRSDLAGLADTVGRADLADLAERVRPLELRSEQVTWPVEIGRAHV